MASADFTTDFKHESKTKITMNKKCSQYFIHLLSPQIYCIRLVSSKTDGYQ